MVDIMRQAMDGVYSDARFMRQQCSLYESRDGYILDGSERLHRSNLAMHAYRTVLQQQQTETSATQRRLFGT